MTTREGVREAGAHDAGPSRRVRARAGNRDIGLSAPRKGTAPASDQSAVGAAERSAWRAANVLHVVRTALGVALVVGIVGGLVASLRQYARTSPRFALSDVQVVGNKRFTADELLAIATVARGDNLFSIDLEAARSRLLANPWIGDAKLARDLPRALHIDVRERTAAALVALGDLFVATRSGEVFKRVDLGDPTDLPVITGLDQSLLTDDRATLEQSVQHALDLAADYEASSLAKREPVQQIHCKPDGSLSLFVGKNPTELVFGRAPYRGRSSRPSACSRSCGGGAPKLIPSYSTMMRGPIGSSCGCVDFVLRCVPRTRER